MRLDELPRSGNVEDLRGKCRLAGGFSIPDGRDGLGIGPAKSRAQTCDGLQNRKFDSILRSSKSDRR